MNPLVELQAHGQSFWYDNIRRLFVKDGTLKTMIDDDGLRGITSNPSIFQKAIGQSEDYDSSIKAMVADGVTETNAIYESLAIADIQAACDLFAELYQQTNGGDGFVSLEVSPYIANDTEQTIAEARRLFATVGRPNVMIKVPATPAGIPAIEQLISESININITLMFSMVHYEAVASAYINGLRKLAANGGDPGRVASVASFFVSRVDTAVDNQLAELNNPAANELMGKVAIANARVVYQRYKAIFLGEAFSDLNAAGAVPQRLLWASTSTKNPAYPSTLYIDQLIGPNTVNTIPPKTVNAFREHGHVSATLEQDVTKAHRTLQNLANLGISLEAITEQLQVAGVASFAKAFDTLLLAVATKRDSLM